MKKILIIGSTGLFGVNFISRLSDKYDLVCNIHMKKINISKNIKRLTLMNKKILKSEVLDIKPDFILNCSGLTDLAVCEKNKKLAFKSNYFTTKNLCQSIKGTKIKLIHISTDHLFNGEKDELYNEKDLKTPLNVYGLTKSKAEDEIRSSVKKYLIIRTNFFGWGTSYRNSITDYIIKNLTLNKKVYLSKETKFNPMYLGNLIDCVQKLIEMKKEGVFNISTDTQLSKFDFGKKIAKIFNLNDKLIIPFEDKKIIKPKNSDCQR